MPLSPDLFVVLLSAFVGVIGLALIKHIQPKSLLDGMLKHKGVLTLVAVTLMSLSAFAPTYAQSDTFTVDTGALISSTNTWITQLFPLLSIGFGISLAIAILYMVFNAIMKGMKQGG